MRLDRPIGSYLLLWPTLWALMLGSDGWPPWHILLVFVLGVFVMRSAGCVINDYADRNVDGGVKRTANRPLVTGAVSEKEALFLFTGLISIAFLLVLTLNLNTILLSFAGLGLASLYPFMKRYTYLPQFVLGAAYSWSIPMAFMAVVEYIPWWGWVLYLANLLWTVAYDTFYAMVDRDDDLNVGIKSTAILFGQFDRAIIAILQLITLALLAWVAEVNQLSWPFYAGMAGALVLFGYQHWLAKNRERDKCFTAFLNNHYAGMLLAIGLAGHYLIA